MLSGTTQVTRPGRKAHWSTHAPESLKPRHTPPATTFILTEVRPSLFLHGGHTRFLCTPDSRPRPRTADARNRYPWDRIETFLPLRFRGKSPLWPLDDTNLSNTAVNFPGVREIVKST